MTEKRYVVPDGMLKAAMDSRKLISGQVTGWSDALCLQVLEAALGWLAENPLMPEPEQWSQLFKDYGKVVSVEDQLKWTLYQWQKRMFLEPQQTDHDRIKDLLVPPKPPFDLTEYQWRSAADVDRRILEAFKRGKASR